MSLNNIENSTEDSFSANKQTILGEIYQTYEDYHYYPMVGLVPDWFTRYWDLAEMVYEAYGFEMRHKPVLSKPEDVEAFKAKIDNI